MADGVRYIVQIKVEGKGWVVYAPKGHTRKGRYTLTVEESAAYLKTLPVEGSYRIVRSTLADGLLNQEVVGYQLAA
jgi:hypothetical protein